MHVGIVLDPAFEKHVPPPGHPECPERVSAIAKRLHQWERFSDLTLVQPKMAQHEWVTAIHSQKYFRRAEQTATAKGCQLDPDTWAGPDSFQTALLAAGSVVGLIQQQFEGRHIQSGMAIVRPPGHHAERKRAMGFCLFNNVAIGAEWAISQALAQRVAIVDFDVHHGNGTQEIFYNRSDVLYFSTHQYPFYPGTGHFREVGEGEGIGFTVNIPLSAGTGDDYYDLLFRDMLSPMLVQFGPQLILVSAGYDAHRDDPLAGMNLTTQGFTRMVNRLNRVAQEVCQGRILYVLEGGYHLGALAEGVQTTIAATLNPETDDPDPPGVEYGNYGEGLRKFFSDYWKI